MTLRDEVWSISIVIDANGNARTVAAYRGISVSEYIRVNVRPIAVADMERVAKEIQTSWPNAPKVPKADGRGRKKKKEGE